MQKLHPYLSYCFPLDSSRELAYAKTGVTGSCVLVR